MKRILKAEEVSDHFHIYCQLIFFNVKDFGVADVGTQVILHIADVPSAAGQLNP